MDFTRGTFPKKLMVAASHKHNAKHIPIVRTSYDHY